MKGEVLFEKMTHISDKYIAEAALLPGVRRPKRERPDNAFTRFMASGWAVAMICALVSLSAVVAMVHWGQIGGPTIPGSTTSDFSFSYQFTDGNLQTEQAHHLPGESFTLHTEIVNHGSPFTYEGSSSDFCAYAQFVLQGNGEITLNGAMKVTADIGTFHVEKGDVGHGNFIFQIPANATLGTYDLVLSYGGEEKVFEGVLVIGDESGNVMIPESDEFIFVFTLYNKTPKPGTSVKVDAIMSYCGDKSYTYQGSSTGFAPNAVFRYRGNGSNYTITGDYPVTDDFVTFEVGLYTNGKATYTVHIPADAPCGTYDLILSYGHAREIFEEVLIVSANGTVTPSDASSQFSFGFEPPTEEIQRNEPFGINTWVKNLGAPFIYLGSSSAFSPHATLRHMDGDGDASSGYVLQGLARSTDDRNILTVETGEVGYAGYQYTASDRAPAGYYQLELSYRGESRIFENVIYVPEKETTP